MSEVAHGTGWSNTVPSGPEVTWVLLEGGRASQGASPSIHHKAFSSFSLQGPRHLAEHELGVGRGAGSHNAPPSKSF